MKINFSKYFRLLWLSCVVLLFGCNEEPDTPTTDPPMARTAIFSVTYDASDSTPMQVGYYLFDTTGKALSYTNKQGQKQTLHHVENQTLKKGTPISIEVPTEATEGSTIVAIAWTTKSTNGFTCNENPESLHDEMLTVSGETPSEYFTGRATLDRDGSAKITLTRATGRIIVDFQGTQAALNAVASAEVVLSENSFAQGIRCDGTLIPMESKGKISLTSGAWSRLVMPTVNEAANNGFIQIFYRIPGESNLRSIEMPLESRHRFTLQPNMQTKLTVTLQAALNGDITPSLTINTTWINGTGHSTDNGNGTQSQFYHTFVRETVFNTNATNATNQATATNATALAVYGDYFYIPTGTWDVELSSRKLVVDVWSISQKKKVGTIETPRPTEEDSFWYAIYSLHISGDKLFVGHGVEDYPGQERPEARIDVFSLSGNPINPTFVTSIGGLIYNPWQDNPNADPDNVGKIAEPFAIYEKGGKVLVLDNYRLSVFNSNDLTSANSGKINQTCFLPAAIGNSLNAADFFPYNGELYLTDFSKSGKGGLRRVNWSAVMQNDGAHLLDPGIARLSGVPVTKITAANDGFFVFSDVESGKVDFYNKEWDFVMNCNSYFANVSDGKYTNVPTEGTNAIPLPTPDDGLPLLLMRSGKDVIMVRIERNYITEF